MKVFISWSGDGTKALAEALQRWLPEVLLNDFESFVSSRDVAKGARGLNVIAENLSEIDYGLVVLTKSNKGAEWINFEAGALGKSLGKAHVSPLLVDLTRADVTGPLEQFQSTNLADKEDVWKLLCDMNKLASNPTRESAMEILFNTHWPTLAAAIEAARKGPAPTKTTRSTSDLLEEILDRVRRLERVRTPAPRPRISSNFRARLSEDLLSAFEGDEPNLLYREGPRGIEARVRISPEARVDVPYLTKVARRYGIQIEVPSHGIAIVEMTGDSESFWDVVEIPRSDGPSD